MPSLRGHHLICLHFYDGEGYGPEFIKNLEATLKTLEGGTLEICRGPDDICKKCPYLVNSRCSYDTNADAEIRDMDDKALTMLALPVRDQADWRKIRKKIPDIFNQWFGSYCKNCSWLNACMKNTLFLKLLRNVSKPEVEGGGNRFGN